MNDEAMIDYAKYARIFKVMSNPKRLKIIDMLSEGVTLWHARFWKSLHYHAANVIS